MTEPRWVRVATGLPYDYFRIWHERICGNMVSCDLGPLCHFGALCANVPIVFAGALIE